MFLLGYHENPPGAKFDPTGSQVINKETVLPVIRKYLDFEEGNRAFQALRSYWGGLLHTLQVDTPDEHTNRMVNTWNAYQCMITFNLLMLWILGF